jgi:hypothetical protein
MITLGGYIAFIDSLPAAAVADDSLPPHRRDIINYRRYINTAISFCAFFGIEADSVEAAIIAYGEAAKAVEGAEPITINPSDVVFGQFIDSKMIVAGYSGENPFATLPYIISIYRQAPADYDPKGNDEDSRQFREALDTPLTVALAWRKAFEQFNDHINTSYTLFQDSGSGNAGGHMKEHMKRWGWVNFLKSVAKTKVFDIAGSGKNSVECARAANLDDVLTWASEDKDYAEAMAWDMEERMRTNS